MPTAMTDKEARLGVVEQPESRVGEKEADVTYALLKRTGDVHSELDAHAQKVLRRKIYLYLVPLLIVINLMMFVSNYQG